ncbi:MAG TPA: hypothetical protein ENN13_03800, partial [Candidatus Altiarchaeales archaeon]|nr:hypothetical protein [Candidatus Altiarchaeales archaeon]
MSDRESKPSSGIVRFSKNLTLMISDGVVKIFSLFLFAVNILALVVVTFFKIIGRTIQAFMHFMPKLMAAVVPKKAESNLEEQIAYSGIDLSADEVLSYTTLYSVVLTIAVFIITSWLGLDAIPKYFAIIATFMLVWSSPYIMIAVLIRKRVDNVEKMLPDVLTIVAQNISSGFTTYNAL